ncbi:T9SS type A sorting domain-containing protein [Hymenobacter sp. 15J16-1T3B]|uniref:T9SS type A sorting domain-containing protein n=1 Tax=Hymenobacter sp. 15J16-1T3B TaxID=2886941 RepID=UPI001D1215B2|nr:T9SS type A sorting domain-containing protein [Hymenobacter sp. 15J16-1T3B]MCC3156565.1 T9SS type A sorting domain-containing protein [Hymenobacter sp. 15J16-1T3B]
MRLHLTLSAVLMAVTSYGQTWVRNYQPPQFNGTACVGRHPGGGTVAVAGSTNGQTLTFIRNDEQGNLLSQRTTTVSARNLDDVQITQDTQGNFLVSHANGLMKLTPDGDTAWTRSFAHNLTPSSSVVTTKIMTGPDGNYVVGHRESVPASGSTPASLQLWARKYNAATGQLLWNTDITSLVAPLLTGSSPQAKTMLARRASGYFFFTEGNVVLLSENGTSTGTSPYFSDYAGVTVFSRSNTTVLSGAFVWRVDDQRNVVAGTTLPSDGLLTSLTEDNEGSFIGVISSISPPGSPGGTPVYATKVVRIPASMQQSTLVGLNFGASAFSDFQYFSIALSASGSYVVAGATLVSRTSGGSYQLTVASVPAFAPLATRPQTLDAGSLRVFPNPAAAGSLLTLRLPAFAGELRVYDLLGRPCSSPLHVTGTSSTLAVPALAAGVYAVRFRSVDGRVWSDRLSVQ